MKTSQLVLDPENPDPRLKRDQLSLKLLAAFNNCQLHQLPQGVMTHYFANEHMKNAWERVAAMARQELAKEKAGE